MKKTGALALMVKTPGFSPVKTRLAAAIGESAAHTFHMEAAYSVAAIMQSAAQILGMQPFFAIAEPDGVHSPLWKNMPNLFQGEGGLGQRMHKIYTDLQKSHGHAILLGADTPQLEIADLISSAEWISGSDETRFSFGPAEDGGFWLFGGNGPLPLSLWTDVEYSQPTTGMAFRSKLTPLGQVQIHRSLNDVDVKEDLPRVLKDLTRLSEPLKEQTALRVWIESFLARGAEQ
jgi:uncharacterized protein